MDQFKLYPNCEILKVENKAQEVEIILKNEVTKSSCPYCEQESDQTHGYYKRNLRDLPVGGREIIISLWVRRFLCANTKCLYKTFGARLEGIVERHAQRSERLIETHLAIRY